ncbi:hypothetical protein M5K25_001146 [Dendrobium thyrsiflorum]|uniref:Reverse transcriptase zinc-binding domain-containing protein n=1 Tax=Dendrobium thyrsiflorum TaxID=117978 RepID=A0ABD0WBM9_DENTH
MASSGIDRWKEVSSNNSKFITHLRNNNNGDKYTTAVDCDKYTTAQTDERKRGHGSSWKRKNRGAEQVPKQNTQKPNRQPPSRNTTPSTRNRGGQQETEGIDRKPKGQTKTSDHSAKVAINTSKEMSNKVPLLPQKICQVASSKLLERKDTCEVVSCGEKKEEKRRQPNSHNTPTLTKRKGEGERPIGQAQNSQNSPRFSSPATINVTENHQKKGPRQQLEKEEPRSRTSPETKHTETKPPATQQEHNAQHKEPRRPTGNRRDRQETEGANKDKIRPYSRRETFTTELAKAEKDVIVVDFIANGDSNIPTFFPLYAKMAIYSIPINSDVMPTCVLCDSSFENVRHLFLKCGFSLQANLCQMLDYILGCDHLPEDVKNGYLLLVFSSIYFIWKEQNGSLEGTKPLSIMVEQLSQIQENTLIQVQKNECLPSATMLNQYSTITLLALDSARKISLETTQSWRISASDSCTCLAGFAVLTSSSRLIISSSSDDSMPCPNDAAISVSLLLRPPAIKKNL